MKSNNSSRQGRRDGKEETGLFMMEAPCADDVRVLGNFNDWSVPLKKQKDGAWKT
jgi:1,4-alpha-glucan branching enzyme